MVVSAVSVFVLFNGFTLAIGGISTFLLGLDIGIAGPIYGSRIDDVENDEKWRASVGLRRELGLIGVEDTEATLASLVSWSAEKNQNTIVEILKLIPQELRFPLDHINGCNESNPEINLNLILRHCSEAIKYDPLLKNLIINQADSLIKYHNLTNRLRYYQDSEKYKLPLNLKKMQVQLSEDKYLLPATQKIPHTAYQRPLTVSWLINALSMNWLYPSGFNLQIIDEKHSVASTMQGIDPFINRRGQYNPNIVIKSLRCVAQTIVQTGIILVGAPLGCIINTLRAFVHYSKSHFKNDFEAFESIERATMYLQAAREDISVLNIYNPRKTWRRIVQNHHVAINTIMNKNDRAAIALVQLLKSNFGISGKSGKLLSPHLKDDIPLNRRTHPYLMELIVKFKKEFDDALQKIILSFEYKDLLGFDGCLNDYIRTNNPSKLGNFLIGFRNDKNEKEITSMVNAIVKLSELKNITLKYHLENESRTNLNSIAFFNLAKTQRLLQKQILTHMPKFLALEEQLADINAELTRLLKKISKFYDESLFSQFHYLFYSAYHTKNTDTLTEFLNNEMPSMIDFPSEHFTDLLKEFAKANAKMKQIVEASSYKGFKEDFSEFPDLEEYLIEFKMDQGLNWHNNLSGWQAKIQDAETRFVLRQKAKPREDRRLDEYRKTLKLTRFIPESYDHRPWSTYNPLSWRQQWSRYWLAKEFKRLRLLALTKNLSPHALFGFKLGESLDKESIENVYKKLIGVAEAQKSSSIEEIRLQAETLRVIIDQANVLLLEEYETLLPITNQELSDSYSNSSTDENRGDSEEES
jgi:hypothetical protein